MGGSQRTLAKIATEGFPTKIEVMRAGKDFLNGEYCISTELSNHPSYTREGLFGGSTATLVIVRVNLSVHGFPGPHWVIGRRLANSTTIDAFYISIANTLFMAPPCRGWCGFSGGTPPILVMDGNMPLDWRHLVGDGNNGLELWTIQVTDTSTSEKTTYTAHRFVLANASLYFRKVLATEFAEAKSCTSQVELGPDEARVFPYLLDYMYAYCGNPSARFPLCTFVCPLFLLGNYFEVPQLLADLLFFVRENEIICANLITGSKQLGAEPLYDCLVSMFADNLEQLSENVMEALDPAFLKKVMQRQPPTKSGSRVLSRLIVGIHEKQPLDREAFLDLTSASHLPHIDPEAAPSLLAMEAELVAKNNADPLNESTTSLQGRCAKVMAAAAGSTSGALAAALSGQEQAAQGSAHPVNDAIATDCCIIL